MIEITAGKGFENAVSAFNLSSAKRTFEGEYWNVWQIDNPSEFEKLCEIKDEDWKDEFGWWRSAEGSNISYWPKADFTVNGKSMIGFYNEDKIEDRIELFVKNGYEKETVDDYLRNNGIFESFTEYTINIIGASTETNVTAIAIDIAKINNITLAELFKRYQPNGRI